ncbi:MAG TPA: DUF368 domain-containing protein, partial [Firmicutes bacterium]|nr:DUF368 domain-containing protein [Bacillota bacterium]
MKVILDVMKGIILGVGIVIPGVSGGALAVVFNLYHALLYAIGHFFEDIKKNTRFLFPIGCGVLIGIVVFSALIQYLLEHFLAPTNFFFIGLILGGLPSIVKSSKIKKVKLSHVVVFLLTLIFIVLVSNVSEDKTSEILTTLNVSNVIRLFIGGVLGAGTMVIPGASGAVMLILLGLYTTVLNAVVAFNIPLMIPFGIGALIGL